MREFDLTESFDNPLSYKWVQQNKEWHRAIFDVNSREYSVIFRIMDDFIDKNGRPVTGLWDITFVPTVPSDDSLAGVDLESVAGLEIKVFSTVIAAANEFITKKRPNLISFSAHKGRDNRMKLYKRILNRYMPKLTSLGYRIVNSPEHEYANLSDFAMITLSRIKRDI